jgi:hypothetical protein
MIAIRLPTRSELLAIDLPWEMHSISIAVERINGQLAETRAPLVTRFATEAVARAAATQPGARIVYRPGDRLTDDVK